MLALERLICRLGAYESPLCVVYSSYHAPLYYHMLCQVSHALVSLAQRSAAATRLPHLGAHRLPEGAHFVANDV